MDTEIDSQLHEVGNLLSEVVYRVAGGDELMVKMVEAVRALHRAVRLIAEEEPKVSNKDFVVR